MVIGVTDCIQVGDEIVNTVLLEANPHSKPLVRGRWSNSLPSPRSTVDPFVFDLEVVPTPMQRFAQRGSNEEREEKSVLQHRWRDGETDRRGEGGPDL